MSATAVSGISLSQFSPTSQKVLQLALNAAKVSNRPAARTDHLVLALSLPDAEHTADLLRANRADYNAIAKRVKDFPGGPLEIREPDSRLETGDFESAFNERALRVLDSAVELAGENNAEPIHILAAIAEDTRHNSSGSGAALLKLLGVRRSVVSAALARFPNT